jgi:hypothetical protein
MFILYANKDIIAHVQTRNFLSQQTITPPGFRIPRGTAGTKELRAVRLRPSRLGAAEGTMSVRMPLDTLIDGLVQEYKSGVTMLGRYSTGVKYRCSNGGESCPTAERNLIHDNIHHLLKY